MRVPTKPVPPVTRIFSRAIEIIDEGLDDTEERSFDENRNGGR